MIEVDVRGFSCPIPVVKTKKAIEENPGEPLAVLIESEVSKENVSRLARSKGYSVEVKEVADDEYHVLAGCDDQDNGRDPATSGALPKPTDTDCRGNSQCHGG